MKLSAGLTSTHSEGRGRENSRLPSGRIQSTMGLDEDEDEAMLLIGEGGFMERSSASAGGEVGRKLAFT